MKIRAGHVDDTNHLAEILFEARRMVYADVLHSTDLKTLTKARIRRFWKNTFKQNDLNLSVAYDDNNHIQGYILYGAAGDDDLDADMTAEIDSLHVHPQSWRKGIGRTLCRHCFKQLRQQGYTHVVVWMIADNHRATAFYRAIGFDQDTIRKEFKMKHQSYALARLSKKL